MGSVAVRTDLPSSLILHPFSAMSLWSSFLVSGLLLACAAGLMVWHVRSWHAARREPLDPRKLDFRRRQFRRRMQTSAVLGLLAVAVLLGEWLVPLLHSALFAALFCIGVLGVLLWIGLMAVTDMMATKFHFSRLHQDYLVEQAKLRSELRRIENSGSNGRKEGGKEEGEGEDNGRGCYACGFAEASPFRPPPSAFTIVVCRGSLPDGPGPVSFVRGLGAGRHLPGDDRRDELVAAVAAGDRPRDAAALGLAVSGLLLVGPLELFFPDVAMARLGPTGGMMLLVFYVSFYGLLLVLVLLMLRPRLIVYNISADQLRSILAETVARLDTAARWAGDSLALPTLGVQLHLDSSDRGAERGPGLVGIATRLRRLAAAGAGAAWRPWPRPR